jgi:hypothetical protein
VSRARRTEAQVRFPPDLAGPIEVELAKLTEHIPAPASMPGGAGYEPKFDGYLYCTSQAGWSPFGPAPSPREAGSLVRSSQGCQLSSRLGEVGHRRIGAVRR